jgi:hypothetical protein
VGGTGKGAAARAGDDAGNAAGVALRAKSSGGARSQAAITTAASSNARGGRITEARITKTRARRQKENGTT